MYELVAEDVVVVGVDAGERHDDTGPIGLRDAAGPFLELLAHHVRLLEVGVVGVEDERLSIKRVPEGVRVPRVPSLRHARRIVDDQRLRRIEEIVEVLRLEDLPREGLVLNLVAPEVLLGLRRNGRNERRQRHNGRYPAHSKSGHEESPADEPQQRVFPNSTRRDMLGVSRRTGAKDVPRSPLEVRRERNPPHTAMLPVKSSSYQSHTSTT